MALLARAALRWQIAQQETEGIIDLGVGDRVQVIQNQSNPICASGRDFVDEAGQHRFDGRGAGGLKHRQGGAPQAGVNSLQGGDDVGPEPGGVVIALVERDPGNPPTRVCA